MSEAANATSTISVALVEDEAVTRTRLVNAVLRAPALELAFAAATAREMMRWLQTQSVDVLLVDLGLPDASGIEVIKLCQRLSPATEIMVITLFGDEAHMMRAFEAGARGYLLKDGTEDDLAQHVQSLHAGGSPMTPVIARQLLTRLHAPTATLTENSHVPSSANALAHSLSPRENDILIKLSRGYTYAETAQLLGVAPSTVQSHVKNIYSKLAVSSKSEAIFEARQLGII